MALSKMIKSMKSDLLVTPLHEQFLAQNANVELTDEVAEFVRGELVAKQRKRSATWSSSSLGYCERKHVYQFLGATKERGVNTDLASIFIHGTWTHLKWQAMGYMAHWLAATEVPCAIPALHYTGTIDGILDPAVVGVQAGWEFKSINSRGYRYVLENGVSLTHKRQIHGYMEATGLRLWSVIYEEKDTQQYKEFVEEYDPALGDSVLEELARLNEAAETRTLLPMREECAAKKDSTYRQCPYRDQCGDNLIPKISRRKIHA